MEDGTYAIVDYESAFKKLNKIKYLNYIARVMEKYYQEDENFNLRLIVIYTGDVQSAEPVYETSCFTLRMEQIRRRINMTQIGQMYEKEKIEYGNQKVRETAIRERTNMAKAMLDEGFELVKIMKITGLTEDELLRLQDEAVTV